MVSSNDNTPLESKTEFDGRVLTFDFPGMQIGTAEYAEGPTGCTVFHFPQGALTQDDAEQYQYNGKPQDFQYRLAYYLDALFHRVYDSEVICNHYIRR